MVSGSDENKRIYIITETNAILTIDMIITL